VQVGNLVRQAPNIFADRNIGNKPMLVLEVNHDHMTVVTLIGDEKRTWHQGELEVLSESR